MNVLHISTHDSGGAGVAAHRLHSNFQLARFQSAMVVMHKSKADVIAFQPRLTTRIVRKLRSMLYKKTPLQSDPDFYFFSQDERAVHYPTRDLVDQVPFKPDVIILYWVANFLTARNIFELQKLTGARILWYMMDLGPFTGGCHYSWSCKAFLTQCTVTCPAILSPNHTKLAYDNFLFKKEFVSKTDLTALLPTKEYVKLFEDSALFEGKRSLYLPIAIDADTFCPATNKEDLRSKKNISQGAKVILLASGSLTEKRKGSTYAVAALNQLYHKLSKQESDGIVVLLAGKNSDMLKDQINFKTVSFGQANSDRELVEMYQLADVFLCPTIQDTGPMMVNEALLCGLPVIGFKIGILPDVIIDGKTGYLADRIEAADLSDLLSKLTTAPAEDLETMSLNCRKTGEDLFHPKVQLKRLIDFLTSTS